MVNYYNIYEHQLNKLSGKFDHARIRKNHLYFWAAMGRIF